MIFFLKKFFGSRFSKKTFFCGKKSLKSCVQTYGVKLCLKLFDEKYLLFFFFFFYRLPSRYFYALHSRFFAFRLSTFIAFSCSVAYAFCHEDAFLQTDSYQKMSESLDAKKKRENQIHKRQNISEKIAGKLYYYF